MLPRFKRQTPPSTPPAEEPAPVQEPQGPKGGVLQIPDELREKLTAALAREVPASVGKEEAQNLLKEVAQKAPALQRELAEVVLQEYAKKVRGKPAPKTPRPPGFLRFLYVKTPQGDWVVSRTRAIAFGMGAALTFTLALMFFSSIGPFTRGSAEASPRSSLTSPSPSPNPLPSPAAPAQGPSPSEEDAGLPLPPQEANGPSQETNRGESAPPVLPPPPSDLPPPPDYEGGAQGTVQPNDFVVYRRQVEPMGGSSPSQPEGVGTLGRKVDEASFLGADQRAPLDEGKSEEGGVGPFWARQGEKGESNVEGGFWSRPSEKQDLALQEASSPNGANGEEGQVEIVYQRRPPDEKGGVIPPAPSSPPAPEEGGAGPGD